MKWPLLFLLACVPAWAYPPTFQADVPAPEAVTCLYENSTAGHVEQFPVTVSVERGKAEYAYRVCLRSALDWPTGPNSVRLAVRAADGRTSVYAEGLIPRPSGDVTSARLVRDAGQPPPLPEPSMPLAITNLTSGAGTSNAGTSASISPTANAMVYAAVSVSATGGGGTGALDTLSVSGAGLTWTLIGKINWGSRRHTFVYRGTSPTPSSGTLSFSFASGYVSTFESMKWTVDQATGVDLTTPEGTPSVNSGSSTSAALSAPLGAPAAGDFVYAAVGVENQVTLTKGSELATTLANVNNTTGARTHESAFDDTPDSDPSPSWSWSGSAAWGIVAFVIKAATGGGGGTTSRVPVPPAARLLATLIPHF